MSYAVAFLICVAVAATEAACAGRDPMSKLRQLRQPVWAPPVWAWVLIGIGWYAISFVALARLIYSWPQTLLPIALLIVLLIVNALANAPLFRLRRLDLSALSLVPYWPLLIAFLWTVRGHDEVTFALFSGYAVYLLVATIWAWQLWRLNPR